MTLSILDWSIIIGYLAFALGIGIYFSRRAGRGMSDFFVTGRSLPWWLAGTSMVATTFAADTPIFITGEVARHGIAGNWLWWNVAIAHMLAVFVFARLWRRARIITDLELIEIRYSGRSAAALRGFRAVYEGILINSIIMSWSLLAMTKILEVFFSFNKWEAIVVCAVITLTYTVLSGLWGVVMTDFLQFIIAMVASLALVIIVSVKMGGMGVLRENLGPEMLEFVPRRSGSLLPWTAFAAYLSLNWWAGKSADGGAYLAQRMFAAKDEGHATKAMLWFTVAHYALRPWPWIIVALFSLVAFPGLADPELGYPKMVARFLPTGLRGMMVVSFLAAFMSTIDTHLNWGSSYLVNDIYKRFVRKEASDRHYVRVSRLTCVLLMVLASVITYMMTSVTGAWKLIYQLTAGIGGVYIMRWLWWRVNAWSEISAWVSSAVITVSIRTLWPDMEFGLKLAATALLSTASWLAVTLATSPVDEERLIEFYRRVKPSSPGWRRVARRAGIEGDAGRSAWGDLVGWIAGSLMVYAFLFGTGKLIFGEISQGLLLLGVGVLGWVVVTKKM